MKFISKIFNLTLVSKLYKLITDTYQYRKDKSYISDTLYSDNFKFVIKQYVKATLKKDWLGRLYGVINPNIDINGNFNINSTIMEIDDEYTNNDAYVRHWVYKQMQLISDLFKINKLYDYINLSIEPVGPEGYDNYLIVIDIVSRKQMANTFKSVLKQLAVYSTICLCVLFYLNY